MLVLDRVERRVVDADVEVGRAIVVRGEWIVANCRRQRRERAENCNPEQLSVLGIALVLPGVDRERRLDVVRGLIQESLLKLLLQWRFHPIIIGYLIRWH